MGDRPPDASDDIDSATEADATVRQIRLSHSFRFGKQLPHDTPTARDDASVDGAAAPGDGKFVVVPGSTRTFQWRWPGEPSQENTEIEPATYYEALTGKRDPQRDFFITARRVINVLVWTIALGLPIGLTALTIATGQSLETIVFVGIAALVVGMLFRSSFPRTPFG